MLPKTVVDIKKHEINRGVRMVNDGTLSYTAFTRPNKSGNFQQKIFPPFPSDEPIHSYEDWASGKECLPKMMQHTEEDMSAGRKIVKIGGDANQLKLEVNQL
jgi:hypothetical protein